MNYKKLGEGSYGCVIKPGLKCHKTTKKNMVSKLLLKKRHNDYKHELKISKRLQHSKKLKFNVGMQRKKKAFINIYDSKDIKTIFYFFGIVKIKNKILFEKSHFRIFSKEGRYPSKSDKKQYS